MAPVEDMSTRLARLKPQLEQEYPIAELGIFGSYARDEQRPDSDLDILVAFERPVSLFDLVRLENELTNELGVDVDLVTKDSLKPRIESRVTEDIVYV
ncbi:DNA polymerase beta [Halorubrum sp. CBA1125]|jgi:predicted nucleotidyltransferase|uniref:nucleotidyltransferase family protein n=1 Tax=Halorubrum sp. CBA1125 TaxID=2668072 RepID=UPI0012E750DB|nr:nucleotidyltransferase family protein [Halorubrum sp. CBA1125]MUW14242.1 DNA polymerase beta [Halorubrum sp. CBA1125]